MQVCKLYTGSMQLVCGCLAPLVYHHCKHAANAARFARERGISGDSRRRRWVDYVHRHVCTTAGLPMRLLVAVPLVAGAAVIITDAAFGDST